MDSNHFLEYNGFVWEKLPIPGTKRFFKTRIKSDKVSTIEYDKNSGRNFLGQNRQVPSRISM